MKKSEDNGRERGSKAVQGPARYQLQRVLTTQANLWQKGRDGFWKLSLGLYTRTMCGHTLRPSSHALKELLKGQDAGSTLVCTGP